MRRRGGPEAQDLVAVGNAYGMRLYSPSDGTVVWVPADDATLPLLDTDVKLAGSFASFQGQSPDRLRSAQTGANEVQLLPDEVVAGRPCSVIKSDYTRVAAWLEGRKLTATEWEWVDKEYGFSLAWKQAEEDGSSGSLRATAVRIDAPLRDGLFALRVPEGVRVFKGPFAPEDARDAAEAFVLAADVGSAGVEPLPALLEQHGPLAGLLPRVLPSGFASLTREYAGGDAPGDTWYISMLLANWKTGGVIVFVQGTSAEVDRREKADSEEQTTARNSPARVLHFSQPYAHLALVWKSGELRYALEGSEVSLAQLRGMADGMEQVTVQPRKPAGARGD